MNPKKAQTRRKTMKKIINFFRGIRKTLKPTLRELFADALNKEDPRAQRAALYNLIKKEILNLSTVNDLEKGISDQTKFFVLQDIRLFLISHDELDDNAVTELCAIREEIAMGICIENLDTAWQPLAIFNMRISPRVQRKIWQFYRQQFLRGAISRDDYNRYAKICYQTDPWVRKEHFEDIAVRNSATAE